MLAMLAGTVTAWKPIYGVGVAGAGFVILLAVLTNRTVRVYRPPPQSTTNAVRSVVPFLLLCYVLPMFTFSRQYSLVGHDPIYLPDVLAVVIASVAVFRARWRYLGLYALVCGLIALLMLHAVYVGHERHYPTAIKGFVLVLYPLVSVPVAGWVSQRADIMKLLSALPRYILPLIPVGMVILKVFGHRPVPGAYGLYYACAGAFVVVRGIPGRKLLAASLILGVALLISFTAKRGVEITLLLSIPVAWIASKRAHELSKLTIVALASGALVALFALTIVDQIIVLPPGIPLLSHIADRASSATTAATNNVTIRKEFWAYALSTTWNEDPLLGVGAYHPIDVDFHNNNIAAKNATGVHDSFIGYTFYAGYPEGVLVVFVYLWGIIRLWRVRRRSLYACAVLGCLVGAIVTALTNVAFELTYIGGPSWLILGLAFGLSAKLMDELDPDDPRSAKSVPDTDALEPALATHGYSSRELGAATA